MKQFLILVFASLVASACRSSAPSPEATSEPAGIGVVGLEMLSDPGVPRMRLGAEQDFVYPTAAPDSPLPSYPADLVPLELSPVVVTFRIVIDEKGTVIEAGQSPAAPSSNTPWLQRFQDSVCETVPTWNFQPAAVRTFAPGADLDGDGSADYKVLENERRVKMLLDLRFTFEVANGKGLVRTAAALQR